MKEKIEKAKQLIEATAKNYKAPCIFSGFGKDSICVIHLSRMMGHKWDIIFYRDPYFPKKYRYANKIIDTWDLVARDYPARSTSVYWKFNTFEVVRHFGIGFGSIALCALLYTPKRFIEGEYLCALRDVYEQPTGDYNFFWDVGLEGHRFVEAKPHSGLTPSGLKWENKQNIGSADIVYPIKDWTNQEVYRYIVDNGIPINTDVYDIQNDELVPKTDPKTGEIDSTFNPDRRPACTECMRPDNPKMVVCPKTLCVVNNVWGSLRKVKLPEDFSCHNKEEE